MRVEPTETLRKWTTDAIDRAKKDGHKRLTPMHFLVTIPNQIYVVSLLALTEVNTAGVFAEIERTYNKMLSSPGITGSFVSSDTTDVKELLDRATSLREEKNEAYTSVFHLFAALCSTEPTKTVLSKYGLTEKKINDIIDSIDRDTIPRDVISQEDTNTSGKDDSKGESRGSGLLKTFGVSLSDMADNNQLDPTVGRSDEIDHIIRILSRRENNAPILVGKPGVGKTSVVYGLVSLIRSNSIPPILKNKDIVLIDPIDLRAGSKNAQEVQSRMSSILKEASDGSTVVFVPRVHELVPSCADIISKYVNHGDVLIVTECSEDDYRTTVKGSSLGRVLQPVEVNEPSVEESYHIVRSAADRLERFHRVRIDDRAVKAAVTLSVRYLSDRFLPEKAINLLDESSASLRMVINSSHKGFSDTSRRGTDEERSTGSKRSAEAKNSTGEKTALTEENLYDHVVDNSRSILTGLEGFSIFGDSTSVDKNTASVDKRMTSVDESTVTADESTVSSSTVPDTSSFAVTDSTKESVKHSSGDSINGSGIFKGSGSKDSLDDIYEMMEKAYSTILGWDQEENASNGDILNGGLLDDRDAEKLLDVIKGSEARIKNIDPAMPTRVGENEVAETLERWTGIPLGDMLEEESEKLVHMETEIGKSVIGQKQAVSAIANAIRRSRAGVSDPNRPIGSFMFYGTSGSGKTLLAKKLAEFLFKDETAITRIDMSEFSEKHAVSRLIGAPPGYVGHESGGQLTDAVKRKPYSVVLLDEIEKAHPEIFNILLQVLDDGRLTDSQGVTVDFKNTIIILTSNIGSEGLIDDSMTEEEKEQYVLRKVRQSFRPEFLNRIDEQVIFKPFTREELEQIVDLELKIFYNRLHGNRLDIKIDQEAKEWLCQEGYSPVYGARPLRRLIQDEIGNKVAMGVLDGRILDGDTIRIFFDKDSDGLGVETVSASGSS